MDSNGRNRYNTFAGDVEINGNLNITGNLTVEGKYPGGGGGGSVDNPLQSDLDVNNYELNNVAKITSGDYPQILIGEINLQNNAIRGAGLIETNNLTTSGIAIDCNTKALTNLNAIQLINGLTLSASFPYSENQVLYSMSTGVIDFKNAVFNPVEENINVNGKNINSVEVLDTNYIVSNIDGIIRLNSPTHILNNLDVFGNIVLDYKSIFNVERLTASHATVNLNLDMIPETEGTAGQILARNPAFNPSNPATHKLVWTNQSGGGSGVNNPMTIDLDAGGFNITNIESLSSNYIDTNNLIPRVGTYISIQGDLDLLNNGLRRVDKILCRSTASVDLKLDLIPDTIGSANQVLGRDPLFNPAGLNTKTVWLDVPLNPLKSNLQSAQFSIFDANILECKTLNILLGGGGISCNSGGFQIPITWGLALKKSTDPFYKTFNTDYITPATNLGLTIDSKLQDGITDSKITLSAPNIVLNNSTNIAPSLISITGNLQITNGNGYIRGNNLIVSGKTNLGVQTPLILEGTSVDITATTVNVSDRLNVLTNRSQSIGVRTTLFKTFGPMPNVNINSLTPVKLNSVIVNQKGDNTIPAGAFQNGDKFIIIMNGILTSIGSGSLNIYLYVGLVQALAFNITNVASTGQPCKITMEVDTTVAGNNVNLSNGTALLSMERFNTAIRYSTITGSTLVDNTSLSNHFDIYVSQSATQVSNFTPISYTIEQL